MADVKSKISSIFPIFDTRRVFKVADYESEIRLLKFQITDPIWWISNRKFHQFFRFFILKGVFGVANYESEIRFLKFKMADLKWRR